MRAEPKVQVLSIRPQSSKCIAAVPMICCINTAMLQSLYNTLKWQNQTLSHINWHWEASQRLPGTTLLIFLKRNCVRQDKVKAFGGSEKEFLFLPCNSLGVNGPGFQDSLAPHGHAGTQVPFRELLCPSLGLVIRARPAHPSASRQLGGRERAGGTCKLSL